MPDSADSKDDTVQNASRDRRLGDEWSDWNWGSEEVEGDIDEKVGTFLTLAALLVCLFLLLIFIGWFMVKPRIDQVHPLLSEITMWSALVFSILFLAAAITESIALLKFKKSLFPYRATKKLILALMPMTVWLGKRFGISKDRVGNSFIKLNNLLTKGLAQGKHPRRLLILLPRCLKKEMKNQIIGRLNGNTHKVLTVGGGEQARKEIRQYSPSCIVALACERDLMSGLRDVAEKIPVFAIPNKRPEGPCKNTYILLEELDDVLEHISATNAGVS